MTDRDLKKRAQVPTPKPRPAARKAALSSALAEFDDATPYTDADSAHVSQTKRRAFQRTPKGSGRRTRLSSNHSLPERKFSMRPLTKYAVAASVAAVAIVGPASLYFSRDQKLKEMSGGLAGLQSFSRGPTGDDRAALPADKSTRLAANKPPVLSVPLPDEKTPRVVQTAKLKPKAEVRARGGVMALKESTSAPRLTQPVPGPRQFAGLRREHDGNAARGAPHAVSDSEAIPSERLKNRDTFETVSSNPVKQVATDPVSTFSLDVDTASYAFVRRALNAGRLPSKSAVRVEELINYFNYDYAPPERADVPFKISAQVVPAPWSAANKLVHLSVKGYELATTERPPANLVFLIDVSGSMTSSDKLPLVKTALKMLVNELQVEDSIGIVTYASGTAVALEPTKLQQKHKVLSVIDGLRSGGSTAGAKGLQDAYRLAEANFNPEGVNRIILATDGDFNVGITDRDDLKGYIERKRKSGVFLSILGFGRGNYNDALMQTLAQNGNGTASYIDTLNEARKVLVDEASSTLFTIAKDVKVQVEFNPARVQSYRLIGYETRALKREDFNNDRVDAGDVGSGHSVTAIYEITPVGAPTAVDALRYGAAKSDGVEKIQGEGEFGFVKLRYKLPNESTSKLISQAITPAQETPTLSAASKDAQFSIAVAGFGQLLRGNTALNNYSYDDVIEMAQSSKGEDRFGYRSAFINMVRIAKTLEP